MLINFITFAIGRLAILEFILGPKSNKNAIRLAHDPGAHVLDKLWTQHASPDP
jgi:hypothetical protein